MSTIPGYRVANESSTQVVIRVEMTVGWMMDDEIHRTGWAPLVLRHLRTYLATSSFNVGHCSDSEPPDSASKSRLPSIKETGSPSSLVLLSVPLVRPSVTSFMGDRL
ncbi:hypothetical protein PM082_018861 [Marasmius tenuissimus]|nr:hypothetical protein PM082_018861 [Marasmius tenuissimus]